MHLQNAPVLAALRSLPVERRTRTTLEAYLEDRLRFGYGGNAFLDELRYFEVVQLSEWLGAWAVWGSEVPKDWRTPSNLHACWRSGFDIAVRGESAVRDFIDSMITRHPPKSLKGKGLPNVFGHRMLVAMHSRCNQEDQLALRQIIVDRAVVHDLFGASVKTAFNIDLPETTRISLIGAASLLKVAPGFLKRTLLALGVVPSEDCNTHAGSIFVDMAQHGPLLEAIAQSRNKAEAADYLGLPLSAATYLLKGGILAPLIDRTLMSGKPWVLFAKTALDQFLEDVLSTGATGRRASQLLAASKYATPTAAGMMVGRPPLEVFQLIVSGALNNSVRCSDERRVDSLLVDVDEVRRHVRRCDGSEKVSASEAATALGLTLWTVRKLIGHGHLVGTEGRNPVNLRDQYYVTREELSRFRKTFIPGPHLRPMIKLRYERLPIKPAFDREFFGIALFRRADIAACGVEGLAVLADIEWAERP